MSTVVLVSKMMHKHLTIDSDGTFIEKEDVRILDVPLDPL